MQKTVGRFLKGVGIVGLGMLGAVLLALLVALRHIMETPQPLESYLPGRAGIYRWLRGHVFYKVDGGDEAPALVLLHSPGIGASSHEMRHLVEPLAEQFRVYVPDLPGFGLSDRPHIDYSAETYITLLEAFLREVVGSPAVVVASGLSSKYAVTVAQRHPTLVERLVLISPTSLFQSEQSVRARIIQSSLMRVSLLATLLYSLVSTRLALRYQASRQRSTSSNAGTSDIDYLYATSHQFGAEHAPLALMAGKLDADVAAQFANIQQPVLMIWGAQALNNLRALTGQHELPTSAKIELIKYAGAAIHEEYPANVASNILEWLAPAPVEETAESAEASVAALPEIPETSATEAGQLPLNEEISAAEPAAGVTEEETAPPLEQAAQVEKQQPVLVVEAYCARCKKKTPMQQVEEVTAKNGNPAIRGKCSICGTGQFRMGRLAL